MRAQADMMNELADYLAAHPNVGNAQTPADQAAALRMVAAMRSAQSRYGRELRPVDGPIAPWPDARPLAIRAA